MKRVGYRRLTVCTCNQPYQPLGKVEPNQTLEKVEPNQPLKKVEPNQPLKKVEPNILKRLTQTT
jgi:hypothetical protein